MKKRTLVMILMGLLLLSLYGCGGDNAAQGNTDQQEEESDSIDETQETQEDTDTYSYVGITFVDEEEDTLIINDVDSEGYPTSMTMEGDRLDLSERDNFSKTESSWVLGVVWSRDDDGNQLAVSDIAYEITMVRQPYVYMVRMEATINRNKTRMRLFL
jgi:ABC-type phosphate transport system substrate-binding protein